MAFNRKQRLRDNIEAIRTAFLLDREQRTPTARERLLLERYCGFGGLKNILNPARELTDAVHWAKSDLELFAPTVELHRLLRENTKDETEYKRNMDAMKQSVLTAFYTPPEITGTIADVLHEHGIRPDRVLEPSAGVGAFVDAVLENRPDADIMAFEKDLMTGKILKHLHPGQKVRVQGFEKIEKPFMNHFDLAVSNIPFGDVAVFDPDFSGSKDPARLSAARTIHNYFFLKSLDAVREGGIVAFITSQGVLDAPTNAPIREYMMNHANLVGVARLPNNLFTDDVDFQMEVTDTSNVKSTTNAEVEAKASAKHWFINAEISGKVTTARENTRMTNQTAKYQIHVTASQQPQTEGLSKLMDIMASCIEPITNESNSK